MMDRIWKILKSKLLWIGVAILAIVGIVLAIFGSNSKALEAAKESAAKEREATKVAIEAARRERQLQNEEKERLKNELRELEERNQQKEEMLDKKKEDRVDEIIDGAKKDKNSIADAFKDRFGFK